MRTRRLFRPQTIDQLVERVRLEFAALPGLQLTEAQVRRVWGLDASLSHHILGRLIDTHYLQVTPTGRYVRTVPPPAGPGSADATRSAVS